MKVLRRLVVLSLIAVLGLTLASVIRGQSIEKTSTGFFWPTGTSNLGGFAGWLANNCDWDLPDTYLGDLYHIGRDIEAAVDDPVYAVADGRVMSLSRNGWGATNIGVLVEHQTIDGVSFLAVYGHVQSQVKIGDKLEAGQFLATIGPFSPPHLHFGIKRDTSLRVPYGRLPCPDEGPITETNDFVDPINWIQVRVPLTGAQGASSPPSPPNDAGDGVEVWRLVTGAALTQVVSRSASFNSDFFDGSTDLYRAFADAPATEKTIRSIQFHVIERQGSYIGNATLTLEILDYDGNLQHMVSLSAINMQTTSTGVWNALSLSGTPSDLVVMPGEFLAVHWSLSGSTGGNLEVSTIFEVEVQ